MHCMISYQHQRSYSQRRQIISFRKIKCASMHLHAVPKNRGVPMPFGLPRPDIYLVRLGSKTYDSQLLESLLSVVQIDDLAGRL